MSRQFYQLEGLIIAHREIGEADWLLLVVTSDYGLIKIVAKGVRLAKSKLRPSLSIWRPVSLTLVKGREIWRLVGAEQLNRYALSLPAERLFAKFGPLILRLVPEEEPAPKLYRELRTGLDYFAGLASERPDGQVLAGGELVMAWRVLAALGYASAAIGVPAELAEGEWSGELLDRAYQSRRQTVMAINHSLAASQL